MSAAILVSEDRYPDEVVESDLPVVADFWAPWCSPCLQLAPVIEELAAELDGKVRFVKVNVDDNPALATELGVQGIPSLLFYRGGEIVDRAVGAYPKPMLRQAIAAAFGV